MGGSMRGQASTTSAWRKEACSFLKKKTKRLLLLRRSHDPGHGRDLSVGTGNKSLLLLFFRKEGLPLLDPSP
jgi:hypothetical protein